MKRPMGRIRQDNKGFALVELLVVTAILGVLAAVVVPNVTGMYTGGLAERLDMSGYDSALRATVSRLAEKTPQDWGGEIHDARILIFRNQVM